MIILWRKQLDNLQLKQVSQNLWSFLQIKNVLLLSNTHINRRNMKQGNEPQNCQWFPSQKVKQYESYKQLLVPIW